MHDSPLPPWIKKIEERIKQAISLPPHIFSPEEICTICNDYLRQMFYLPHCTATLEISGEKHKEEFFDGMLAAPVSFFIEVTPLKGYVLWIMNEEDIRTFVSWMQSANQKKFELDNFDLILGIYQYAIFAIVKNLQNIPSLRPFSYKILKKQPLEDIGIFFDISFCKKDLDQIIWGRCIISHNLYTSFDNYISPKNCPLSKIFSHCPHSLLPISLCNGSIELNQKELLSLQEGDFLIIHNALFHPQNNQGTLQMYLADVPIAQVQYESDHIKIVDLYTEL